MRYSEKLSEFRFKIVMFRDFDSKNNGFYISKSLLLALISIALVDLWEFLIFSV
jgi:hypothetical protein